MRVRHKTKGHEGWASGYNHASVSPAEMVVTFDDGSASSEYVRDYDPVEGDHEDLLAFLDSREQT